jgi:hypothetical protein
MTSKGGSCGRNLATIGPLFGLFLVLPWSAFASCQMLIDAFTYMTHSADLVLVVDEQDLAVTLYVPSADDREWDASTDQTMALDTFRCDDLCKRVYHYRVVEVLRGAPELVGRSLSVPDTLDDPSSIRRTDELLAIVGDCRPGSYLEGPPAGSSRRIVFIHEDRGAYRLAVRGAWVELEKRAEVEAVKDGPDWPRGIAPLEEAVLGEQLVGAVEPEEATPEPPVSPE